MAWIPLFSAIFLFGIGISPTNCYRPDFCLDKENALYADPDDCTKFYQCFSRYAHQHNCPPGLHYNINASVCDWPYQVDCKDRKIPIIPPTTTAAQAPPTTTKQPVVIPKNNDVEPSIPPYAQLCYLKADGFYSFPENCTRFVRCYNGFTHHFICPSGLHFNPVQQYCDWPWNVNCSAPVVDNNPKNPTGTSPNQAEKCRKVVCYVPDWGIFRVGVGATFGPQDVNPDLCTHVVYAYSTLQGNKVMAANSTNEASPGHIGNLAKVVNLKQRKPSLKILMGIGGWNMNPDLFYNMSSSDTNIAEFVSSLIGILRATKFDGVSFDWTNIGGDNRFYLFRNQYTKVCEELRKAFDQEAFGDNRLILSTAVSIGNALKYSVYDIPRLAAVADIISILGFDLHGAWENRTGHPSPLRAADNEDPALTVEWAAKEWANRGAPKVKLVIGLALYARTYTLAKASDFGVGAPILGPGIAGRYTNEAGYLSYYEVCTALTPSNQYFIEAQRVPYAVTGDQWIGYENPASLKEKVQFVKQNGFGGVMAYDLSHDDFSGKFCGGDTFPLMKAIINQCAA